MAWLWFGSELAVEVLACWTLAVHACRVLDTPAWVAWPFALLAFSIVALAQRGRVARLRGASDGGFALAALAIGVAFCLPALVLVTPSGDDFNFFQRAAWQATHPGAPFARGDTAFDVPGLPALSPLHALTTWELGLAMNAALLGFDPLGVYHNGAVVLNHLLLAALFALWMRALGFGRRAALVGCAAVFLFFYVDDPHLRSWAIAYRMLWVGKMLQWTWLLPAALLFALRYLRTPSVRTWLHPALCGVAAIGLSGTGVFLLPGAFAAASLGGLAQGGWSLRRVAACALLNLASAYCLWIGALLVGGVLATPVDTSAWRAGYPSDWFDNLMLVAGNGVGLARNAWLALAVPALCLRAADRRFLVGYGLALVVIFTNPLTGPLWLETVQPASYWRVMLLFVVPLGAAVAVGAPVDASAASRRTWLALAVALGLAGAARLLPVAPERVMQHRFTTKSPFDVRLPPDELAFLREVAPALEGRDLLAAPGIATSAALYVPSLRLEAARLKDTRHLFANVGRPLEGLRRTAAWQWMRACDVRAPGLAAFRESIRRGRREGGVDALIFRDCGREAPMAGLRGRLLEQSPGRWVEVARDHGFVLFVRDPQRAASPLRAACASGTSACRVGTYAAR